MSSSDDSTGLGRGGGGGGLTWYEKWVHSQGSLRRAALCLPVYAVGVMVPFIHTSEVVGMIEMSDVCVAGLRKESSPSPQRSEKGSVVRRAEGGGERGARVSTGVPESESQERGCLPVSTPGCKKFLCPAKNLVK